MPVIIDGTSGVTTPTYGGADTSEYLVPVTQFKNRIINGAMVIDQRNAGASVTQTTADLFPVDRFRITGTVTSKFTAQRSTTAPAGFINSVICTSSSAYTVGSSERFLIGQAIEGFNMADFGWGTADAKTVTLSFWVRSSLTGTFGGVIRNSAGDRSYPFSYTISSANTYEFKSVTITGDTTGTWEKDNNVGMFINFSLGAGSTLLTTAGAWAAGSFQGVTGQVNLVATNGATFYITGVQLEVGSTATSFDYRPYGTELALCQRYYEIFGASLSGMSRAGTSPGASFTYSYKVTKRANPTLGLTGNFTILIPTVGTYTITSILGQNITTNTGVFFDVNTSATTGTFNFYICAYDGTDKFTLSAEL